ncbi:MAG: hypothetical protein E7354_02315 [Clostridiales bacterium]|nr:hypothetical protein [Clostridiales bacterium]
MRNIRINRVKRGVYTFSPRLLRFCGTSMISDDELESLFVGFFRLLKSTIKDKLEYKYLSKITRLERELRKHK